MLAAQIPDTTARPDTVARDTVDAYTLLVEGEEDARVRLPTLPEVGGRRLLPPMARIIVPRDSIDVRHAETVGDLLAGIPGVYLWRGGWIGQPEGPSYRGRGAAAVEYLIDGVPWVPLGTDSLAADPTLFPLGMLDRIEIETLPGLLRVHLTLRRHDLLAPRTRIAIGRGQFEQARYEGLFEKRFRSGFGLTLAGEQLASGRTYQNDGTFSVTNSWGQVDFVPSGRFGVQVRYRGMSAERTPARSPSASTDTTTRGVDGQRGDLTARMMVRSRADGLGGRVDAFYSRTTWSDTLDQRRWQAGLLAGLRQETWSLGASAILGSRFTRFDGRAHLGWAPTEFFSAAVEGVTQAYDSTRSGRWITARGGLRLPLGVELGGTVRMGDLVARPAVAADTAQELSEQELSVGWTQPWAGLRVTWSRLGDGQPVPFRQFIVVDSLSRPGTTEWLTVAARLRPRQWLTISGWFSDPLDGSPEGNPPTHSVVEGAIRSKFLRTFPSGIFDLKLALTVETWGAGVLGRDAGGLPVQVEGATMMRGLIQVQFSGFIFYFDRLNLVNSRKVHVPGLPAPLNGSTFGVRWTFLN